MGKKGINEIIKYIPGFRNRITKISLQDIEPNSENPRRRYGQEEEDELIESINSKGVLQPIIVFEDGNKKYVLLDGQRRISACKKLGFKEIPAHILDKKPSPIENISIMFHIHNIYEEWTDMAIVTSLGKLISELGINKNNLTKEDIQNLKKLTSLSEYKIRKYQKILKYSKPVLNRFMESELKENPDIDLDLLSELSSPFKSIKEFFPEIVKKYPEKEFVEVFIQKKKDKIIQTNKEIRNIFKIINNAKKGKINKNLVKEKILDFLEDRYLSINQIYSETSESIEQSKLIKKTSEKLRRDISNLDLGKLPKEDKKELIEELKKLINSIREKK